MSRFYELNERPDFGIYNTNDILQLVGYNEAIRADAEECIKIIKENIVVYVNGVNSILTMVLEHKITSTDHYHFKAMYNHFNKIVKQFIDMDARYRDIQLPADIKAYVYNTLVKMADEAALGIYEGNKTRNHPDVVENTASMVIDNEIEADLETLKNSMDDLGTVLQKAAEAREEMQKQATAQKEQEDNSKYKFVKSTTTFKDVAGLHEVKEDLAQYVDMLKRPDVYKAYGAKLPNGTIFYGPPGTGKTLLSRALAGEAGVKFIATAATDFTSSKWGETPQKIKELFQKARKNAPCIVFIDEIDMLGMNRGMDSANGLAHREHLNALLAEMDGFDQYEGVMIIGATNRLEDLDPALIRPGRFDNQFSIPLPNSVDEVEEIVRIYMKNKRFDETVNTRNVAQKLLGNSPASIEGLLNEACLLAIRKNNGIIRIADIDEAYVKKAVRGHVKNLQDVSEEEREIVAYHEAGHALLAVVGGRGVQSVSILGTTTGAGGLTVTEPMNKHLLRKSDYETQIRISYGGRAAEEVIFGEDMITTGASADIRKCTALIGEAASSYGFDLLNSKNPVPKIKYNDAKNIKDTIEKASIKYYEEAVQLIKDNLPALKDIANALLENGTITGEVVQKLYDKYQNNAMEMEM